VQNTTPSKERLGANAVKVKDCSNDPGCWDLENDCLNLISQIKETAHNWLYKES